jgi:hypothetical protein
MTVGPEPEAAKIDTKAQADLDYLAALRGAFASGDKALFDYFYECLSIIDGKAASLLQFNSVLVAAATVILVTTVGARDKLLPSSYTLEIRVTMAVIVLLLVSSCVLLITVWVFWATTKDIEEASYLRQLLHRRDNRTLWYRAAWCLSAASLPAFLVELWVAFRSYLS